MKTPFLGLFFGLAAAAFAGSAATDRATRDVRVSVAFLHPDTYSDVGNSRSARERDGVLRDLGASMQRAAGSYLRNGLQLELQVTDVDLAGDVESWRGGALNELRVVRDVYPPRMKVSYKLRDASGRVISRGDSRLSNPNFQFGAQSDRDPLRYDKELFRDWLRNEFAEYRK